MRTFHDDCLLLRVVYPDLLYNDDSSSGDEEMGFNPWAIDQNPALEYMACITQNVFVYKSGASTGMTMGISVGTVNESPVTFYELSD
jgi:hypothetical protein